MFLVCCSAAVRGTAVLPNVFHDSCFINKPVREQLDTSPKRKLLSSCCCGNTHCWVQQYPGGYCRANAGTCYVHYIHIYVYVSSKYIYTGELFWLEAGDDTTNEQSMIDAAELNQGNIQQYNDQHPRTHPECCSTISCTIINMCTKIHQLLQCSSCT